MNILISAGPMRSKIDPIRYIQNSSSGRLGLEFAKELNELVPQAEFEFILGPVDSIVHLQFEELGSVTTYNDSAEYKSILLEKFPNTDLFISAAAVLDYEIEYSSQKESRSDLSAKGHLNLKIKPVEDFVALVGQNKRPHQKVLAFSLDTRDAMSAIPRAIDKMKSKNADWIYLNYANQDSGPEKSTSSGLLLSRDETVLCRFSKDTKVNVAKTISQQLISPRELQKTEEKPNDQNT